MPINADYRGPAELPEVIPVFPLPGALLLPRELSRGRVEGVVDNALAREKEAAWRVDEEQPPAGRRRAPGTVDLVTLRQTIAREPLAALRDRAVVHAPYRHPCASCALGLRRRLGEVDLSASCARFLSVTSLAVGGRAPARPKISAAVFGLFAGGERS